MKKIVLLFSILFILGCTSKDSYYKKSDITVLEVDRNDKIIEVYYSVPLETLYYSSGVNYEYDNTNDLVNISFIRQKINKKNNAMVQSSLLKNTSDSVKIKEFGINSYIVKIPLQKQWNISNNNDKIINIVD